jgi:hypothetical protein
LLSSGARAITAIKASQKAEISPIPFVLIKNGRSRYALIAILKAIRLKLLWP